MTEQLFRLKIILSNKADYDAALWADSLELAIKETLNQWEGHPNLTYFSIVEISHYELNVKGCRITKETIPISPAMSRRRNDVVQ